MRHIYPNKMKSHFSGVSLVWFVVGRRFWRGDVWNRYSSDLFEAMSECQILHFEQANYCVCVRCVVWQKCIYSGGPNIVFFYLELKQKTHIARTPAHSITCSPKSDNRQSLGEARLSLFECAGWRINSCGHLIGFTISSPSRYTKL